MGNKFSELLSKEAVRVPYKVVKEIKTILLE